MELSAGLAGPDRHACVWRLLKDPEVPEQPPQQHKDKDRRNATAAQLLRPVTGGEPAQNLAHRGGTFADVGTENPGFVRVL